jgi:type III secretion protein T
MNDPISFLQGLAVACIRPAVALALLPLAFGSALGVTLRLPIVFSIAIVQCSPGWPDQLMLTVAMEVTAGLILGLLLRPTIAVAAAAGALLDQQAGYTFATVYDPNAQEEAALFQTLLTQLAGVLVYTEEGLRLLVDGFLLSWKLWPMGEPLPELLPTLRQLAMVDVLGSLEVGVRWASPLLGLLLLVELGVGLMNRIAPQLNSFGISTPVKALLGSIGMCLALPYLAREIVHFYRHTWVLP